MASGTKNNKKGGVVRGARSSVVSRKGVPWGTVIAVVAVLALAGGVFTYAYTKIADAKRYTVSDDNQDPSGSIDGVVKISYPNGLHVKANQRVAYDQSPPFGGPHDEAWADCDGMVYPTAVRNENMVHALEHGTVWITYNPDQVKGPELDKLKAKVTGQDHMMLSPYPNLDHPISLQSWGHQLRLTSADDPRIDEFIKSLRLNKYQYPEVGASCDSLADAGLFDPDKPPAYNPAAPGPDAIPMNGKGAINQGSAEQQGQATPTGAAPSSPGSSSAKPTTTTSK